LFADCWTTTTPKSAPPLAQLAQRPPQDEVALHRVLNANFRLGGSEQALAVAGLAARRETPEATRLEALRMLAAWSAPFARDRVLGMWRPPLAEARDIEPARAALRGALPALLTGTSDALRTEALTAAQQLGLGDAAPWLKQLVDQTDESHALRGAAVVALAALKDPEAEAVATRFLRDDVPELRAAARDALAAIRPEAAIPELKQATSAETTLERQRAFARLAEIQSPDADRIISQSLRDLLAGNIAADTQLDVLDAARTRKGRDEIERLLAEFNERLDTNDALAPFRVALLGGNAERGRRVFFERTEVSCVRCHKVDGVGGEVGLDLSLIGKQKERLYLLESLIEPNRSIAENFRSKISQPARRARSGGMAVHAGRRRFGGCRSLSPLRRAFFFHPVVQVQPAAQHGRQELVIAFQQSRQFQDAVHVQPGDFGNFGRDGAQRRVGFHQLGRPPGQFHIPGRDAEPDAALRQDPRLKLLPQLAL
jgi:quinoprotein glucose dehydrogenase